MSRLAEIKFKSGSCTYSNIEFIGVHFLPNLQHSVEKQLVNSSHAPLIAVLSIRYAPTS